MKKLAIISTFLTFIFASSSSAEVTTKYDEFQDLTTVSLRPAKNWDGKSPTLYMETEIKGKPVENEVYYLFSVIIRSNKTNTCIEGVTGVIADGVRVKTVADVNRRPYYPPGKMVVVSRLNPSMPEYLGLYEKFYPAEFEQIVKAKSVKYQICGNPNWVYELTPAEMAQLRKYAEIVMPQPTEPSKGILDIINEASEKLFDD